MAMKKSPLYVVVCIVDQTKTNHAAEIMTNLGVYFHITMLAENKEVAGIMDMLGMSQSGKGVILGICPTEKMHDVIRNLCRNLELYRERHGIAFSIPVTAISREDLNTILKFVPEKKEIAKEAIKEGKTEEQIETIIKTAEKELDKGETQNVDDN